MAQFVRSALYADSGERQLVLAEKVVVGDVLQWQDAPHVGLTYFGEVTAVKHKGKHTIVDVVRADRFYFTGKLVKQRFSLALDTLVTLRPDITVEPGPSSKDIPITHVYTRGSRVLTRKSNVLEKFNFVVPETNTDSR